MCDTDEAEYYDLILDRWVQIASLPQGRSECGAAQYRESLYLGGGSCEYEHDSRNILRYNMNADCYTTTTMRIPKY